MENKERCCREGMEEQKTCECEHVENNGCANSGRICSDERKRRCGSSAVKIIALLILGAVVIIGFLKDTDLFTRSSDTIQVIGQGKVPVKPDTALVNLGVMTIKADTPEAAIQQTSDKLQKVSAALEALGIPAENAQVTGYVLNPRYKDPTMEAGEAKSDAAPTIDGYTCSQQITVRIPEIADDKEMINKVIVAAAKEGANQVGEVKFLATNAESVKQQARLKAIADAKDKARNMADVAGLKLGRISSWYENVISAPAQGYPQSTYMGPDSQTIQNPAPAGIVVLQPGQLDMIVEVTVSYSVK